MFVRRFTRDFPATYDDIGRNEKFLEHSRKYAMCVFGGATIINMLPPLLRPIVGPLVALTGKRHLAICQKLCLPIVEERLRHTQRRWAEPDYQWEPPVRRAFDCPEK